MSNLITGFNPEKRYQSIADALSALKAGTKMVRPAYNGRANYYSCYDVNGEPFVAAIQDVGDHWVIYVL